LSIKENIEKVKSEISNTVTLVAVSKTRELKDLEQAYEVGLKDFGENKVQEFLEKYDNFHNDVKWHFIGHLQKNKVKYIVGKIGLIHTLDSISLLNEIEKRYSTEKQVANVLIQVNIGRDPNKSGVLLEDLEELVIACEKCSSVKVKGLMTILPKGDEDSNRKYFREMKNLYDSLSKKSYNNIVMEYLSMGMSGDYNIAILEGANMIRIGEGIFGKREYNNF
jgi:pyridoxal phosphate enzyme (YggS family)